MGSRYALIASLINSASDWASASPSTCPSLSTPKYGEPPVVFAKALTALSQEFFFFLSSSLLKSYVEHSAIHLVSMVSIYQSTKVSNYMHSGQKFYWKKTTVFTKTAEISPRWLILFFVLAFRIHNATIVFLLILIQIETISENIVLIGHFLHFIHYSFS